MTTRDPSPPPRGGGVSTVVVPGRWPPWTEPPLPGGPDEVTKPGSATMNSLGGGTSAQLVKQGHRVPILYGRRTFAPDVVTIVPDLYTPTFYGVISEGPIQEIEYLGGGVESPTTSLGSLSPTAGLPSWSIGLACFTGSNVADPFAITCVAKGRLLYDPRIGAWGAGEYPDAAKTAYSTNPALVMADLLTFPQYGLGVLPTAVDWDSVEAAADWCDVLFSGVKRYEVNLWLAEGGTAEDWMTTVGLHAGLRWREAAGLWRLDYADGTAAVEATVTEDDIVEGSRPSVRYGAGSGLSGQPNRFTAEWTDATTEEIRIVTVNLPEVDAGGAIREASVYRLHGFLVEAQAKRALERIAAEIHSEVEIDLTLPLDFLHLDVGSRFNSQLPSLGLVGVDWRVTRIAYDADAVRLTAVLFAADTWAAPDAEDLAGPTPVGADDPLQGYLPSPPPPAPVAAPTAPAVLAPPPVGLVPLYRSINEDPAPADGEVATWDAATKTVRFEVGGGGGGGTISVQEQPPPEGATVPVEDVALLMFAGATVTNPTAGVALVTITPAAGGGGDFLVMQVFS